jgi:hypothetical protein
LNSFIHMLINRVIPDQARLHETIIYDFLFQYYKSEIGRVNSFSSKQIG